jgi:transposase
MLGYLGRPVKGDARWATEGRPMQTASEIERRTLTELLDLEGFEVVEAASDRAAKLRRLTVVPAGEPAALCPACGAATADRHACHDREVTDLPLGGWRTELLVRPWQFACGRCGRYFTPRHAALAPGAHATGRFLDRLAELATVADVSAAARFLGVAEKTAERWYYEHLERRREEPAKGLAPVRSLGIDELSLKKGTGSSSAC